MRELRTQEPIHRSLTPTRVSSCPRDRLTTLKEVAIVVIDRTLAHSVVERLNGITHASFVLEAGPEAVDIAHTKVERPGERRGRVSLRSLNPLRVLASRVEGKTRRYIWNILDSNLVNILHIDDRRISALVEHATAKLWILSDDLDCGTLCLDLAGRLDKTRREKPNTLGTGIMPKPEVPATHQHPVVRHLPIHSVQQTNVQRLNGRRSNLNRGAPPRLRRCRSCSSASSHRTRAWRRRDRDRLSRWSERSA